LFRSLREGIENFVDNLRDFVSEVIGAQSVVNTDIPDPKQEIVRSADIEDQVYDTDIPDDDDDDEEPEDHEWLDYLDAIREADFPETAGVEYRSFEDADIQAKYLRVVRYTTAEEAATFLEEAGLTSFAEILYLDDEDTFTVAIYDSPGSEEA